MDNRYFWFFMARRNHPTEYLKQRELFKKMKSVHDADLPNSVLTPKLTEAGIDLVQDAADGVAADAHEKNRADFSKQAEDKHEQSKRVLTIHFSKMRSGAQYLKSLFKPDTHKVGEWTIEVNGDELVYPTEFLAMCDQVLSFYAVHNSFPAGTSKLLPFITENSIDVTATIAAVGNARTVYGEAKQLENNAEEETALRNQLWLPVDGNVEDIGEFILSLHPNNPKKAGRWGYTIDDSPREDRLRTSTIKPAQQRTTKGVAIGKPITYEGTGSIAIYRGDKAEGVPVVLKPGEQFVTLKGYSTVTIVNLSATVPARYTIWVHS